jgi:hypothetical protein
VSNCGGETLAPCEMQLRALYMFTCPPPPLLTYRAFYTEGYGKHIQNGSHDYLGPANAWGSKAKPARWVRAAQSEGQSNTRGGQQLAHPEPHRGDLTHSSFISESRPGGFLHAPLWTGNEPSGFSARITRERSVKPLSLDLIGGGGALAPVWFYGEALTQTGSHSRMVTHAPLRS